MLSYAITYKISHYFFKTMVLRALFKISVIGQKLYKCNGNFPTGRYYKKKRFSSKILVIFLLRFLLKLIKYPYQIRSCSVSFSIQNREFVITAFCRYFTDIIINYKFDKKTSSLSTFLILNF